MSRYRSFLCTIHDPTPAEYESLDAFCSQAKVKYAVYGKEECPTTGRPHAHVALFLKDNMTIAALHKKLIGRHINDVKAPIHHADPSDAKFAGDYCKKGTQSHDEWNADGHNGLHFGDDADFKEFGTPPVGRGTRTDLEDLREAVQAADRWVEVINNTELTDVLRKNLAFAKELFANKKPIPRTWEEMVGPDKPMYPWQKEVIELIEGDPDNRSIYWVYDPKGCNGKTVLQNYILRNYDAIALAGKAQDMYCAYDMQKIIVCDIPRSTPDEYINYGAYEKLKDGTFFSGKYVPQMKVRNKNAHVVVFSNNRPDATKWTADRLKLIELSQEPERTDHQFFQG